MMGLCQRKIQHPYNVDITEFLKLLSKWVQRIYPAVQGLGKKKTGSQCPRWRTVNKKEWGGLCVHVCLCSCLLGFAHPQELSEDSRYCPSADSLQLGTCTSLVNARQCRLVWAPFLDLAMGLVCDYALGNTDDLCFWTCGIMKSFKCTLWICLHMAGSLAVCSVF